MPLSCNQKDTVEKTKTSDFVINENFMKTKVQKSYRSSSYQLALTWCFDKKSLYVFFSLTAHEAYKEFPLLLRWLN